MNSEEQALHQKASEAFHNAVQGRDNLPKEEQGKLNWKRVHEDGLSPDNPEAWEGRSARYQEAQAAVDAAYAEIHKTDRSYFRLNIRGMGRYTHAMSLLGMAYTDSHEDRPDWPDWSVLTDDEHDLVRDLADTIRQETARQGFSDHTPGTELATVDDKPVRPELVEHVKAQLAVTLWTPDPDKGIYLGKFSSNDDWWVTPAEIRAALKKYRSLDGARVSAVLEMAGIQGQDYWMQWIQYLMYAEQHGGFIVG